MVRFNTDHSHTCRRCGCTFWSTKKAQIFCSVRCREGSQHGNSDKCFNCGAATTDGKLFCSPECAKAYNSRMTYRRRTQAKI